MIEAYHFGSMTIAGKKYHSDVKIIGGKVIADWWRGEGHRVDVVDVQDVLAAGPDILVIGQGDPGNMQVNESLQQTLQEKHIQVIVEPTKQAIHSFNRLYETNKNVAGAFHLTC